MAAVQVTLLSPPPTNGRSKGHMFLHPLLHHPVSIDTGSEGGVENALLGLSPQITSN